jgi:hypothetical protein
MMNLAKQVRNAFTSNDLSKYIVEDGGGSSLEVLTSILQDSATLTTVFVASKMEADLSSDEPKLLRYLKAHGPALVARYQVDEKFGNMKPSLDVIPYLSHTIIQNDKDGRHSMILVGMRRVEDKWRLLLQNWWPGMQFIEVSSDTIVSSSAMLYFSIEKQTIINDTIPTLMDKQAETFVGGRDHPERACPERQFLSTGSVYSSSSS